MPSFAFVALDAQGQQVTDHIDAASQAEATNLLRSQGLFPTSVKEQATGSKVKAKKSSSSLLQVGGETVRRNIPPLPRKENHQECYPDHLTRQLATLIDAGLPLLRGLTVLGIQEPDLVLKKTISQLADSVQSGSNFSDGLLAHPRIFNKLYVNMVKAGELGGVLEIVLNRLAEFQEKAEKVKGKVKSAMMYPCIVLVIAVVIVAGLLVFIVPKFEQIFADMLGGKPLPSLPRSLLVPAEASPTTSSGFSLQEGESMPV